MKLITITDLRMVEIKPFVASDSERTTLIYTIKSYGWLMGRTPRQLTFAELADEIEAQFDCTDPRNHLVVQNLRTIHSKNCLPA